MKKLSAVLFLLPCLGGCSVLAALDFGGSDKKPFEFNWGWEHSLHAPASGTPSGGVDKDGVYKPETPEADAVLGFPNITTGFAGEIRPRPSITPDVGVEVCRAKFPYVRWWEIQVGAGAQIVEVGFLKRLVSVFDISAGPWIGWDFERHHQAYGACIQIIKF
jgi:hypothetical protein